MLNCWNYDPGQIRIHEQEAAHASEKRRRRLVPIKKAESEESNTGLEEKDNPNSLLSIFCAIGSCMESVFGGKGSNLALGTDLARLEEKLVTQVKSLEALSLTPTGSIIYSQSVCQIVSWLT